MSKEIKVISWELPLARSNNRVDMPAEYLQKLSNASDGFYPMGTNSLWHGGIHLDGAHLTATSAIGCIANGDPMRLMHGIKVGLKVKYISQKEMIKKVRPLLALLLFLILATVLLLSEKQKKVKWLR